MTLTCDNLQEIISDIKRHITEEQKKELTEIEQRLSETAESQIKILVCGEFKRGKSSFVNAFLGRGICAVDQDICTSVVSVIKYGEKERVIRNYGNLSDIQQEEIPFDKISNYSVGSAEQVQNTLFLEIELPHDILKSGLSIIDTPGVGGLDPRHAFITTYFLPFTDVTLFMTDVNEPLTTTELDFFKNKVAKYAERDIVIINKSDLKSAEQVETVKNDTITKISGYCNLAENQVMIYAVSSKSKLNFDKTKIEKLYDRSGFKTVYSAIENIVSEIKNHQVFLIQNSLKDFLDNIINPLELQLEQIKMPDPKIISDLKQRQIETEAKLKALNDPYSEFRLLLQKRITECREEIINNLNDKSIIFSNTGLTNILNNERAKNDDGNQWVASQLNAALESLVAETELELRKAFDKIASMEEFEGMLEYNARNFKYKIKTIQTNKQDIPIHKRLMSLMPGMGAGFATKIVATSVLGVLGTGIASVVAPIAAVAVGLGIAIKSHSDTVNNINFTNLKAVYQPQITSAMQQLRTFIETRLSEFQQELMSVISSRVKNNQASMQNLVKEMTTLANDQKAALSKKISIEKRLTPLLVQREKIASAQ